MVSDTTTSIIQSFLTYVVKQQDSSDKHNDCSDQSIDEPVDLIPLKFLLVPCCRAEISFHSSILDDCCQVP